MSNHHVLIVDHEKKIRVMLRRFLVQEDFQIKEAATGQEAMSLVKKNKFDIILLDVMIQDMDGWQVCKNIREIQKVPILILTARNELKDKVYGLRIGADDYLTKPFETEELLARMYSLIRRSTLTQTLQMPAIKLPQLTILANKEEVYVQDDIRVELTPKEYALLTILANNIRRVFSREELVEKIWGREFEGEARAIDVHVKNVRKRLKNAGLSYNPIQTVHRVGYKFNYQKI